MQILTLKLDMPLHPGDISGFRAAIVELVGREHEVFHNHDNSQQKDHFHRGYPRIQYKVRGGKATIVAMAEGADLIKQYLLPKLPEQLTFAKKQHSIKGYEVHNQSYEWRVQSDPVQYGIVHWLALNVANYEAWKKAQDEGIQRHILNRAITGHLRSFARAIAFPYEEIITGEVLEVHRTKKMSWHGQAFVGFNAIISTNLILPRHIGLGRLTAFGFGETQPLHIYQKLLKAGKRHRPKKNIIG